METLNISIILILSMTGFVAAFIDSAVGGGGLISLPTLLSLGLPVNLALGTNKLASSMGALSSFISFLRAGKINKKIVFYLMPLSFISSALGALTVHFLPQYLLKYIIVILLTVVAIYTYFKKDWTMTNIKPKVGTSILIISILMAIVIGFYDGFFGPGTGSFLIFGFLFLGYNFIMAAGNAKALNFASNIGGLIAFALSGSIIWQYGLIMGIFMIIGAQFGSKTAIKYGTAYIKPLFLIVTSILITKQIYDIFLR